MKFVVVTGLSGAGKSETMKYLEDMGFYCVDNLPSALISKFAHLCHQTNNNIEKIALGIDIRGLNFFDDLNEGLNTLNELNFDYDILFLDCSDVGLVKRYKTTRRKHPLACNGDLLDGIQTERKLLENLKDKAYAIIDTTNMKPKDLKEEIGRVYFLGEKKSLTISIESFGFKHGIPVDADLMFDVRFLPNPFYIEELREQTGNDQIVRDYVMNSSVSHEFLDKLKDMIVFLIPQYIQEGKSHLVIAIGCTGGRHRSVTISNLLYDYLTQKNYSVSKKHRDFNLR